VVASPAIDHWQIGTVASRLARRVGLDLVQAVPAPDEEPNDLSRSRVAERHAVPAE
jgi:hypothetical protein